MTEVHPDTDLTPDQRVLAVRAQWEEKDASLTRAAEYWAELAAPYELTEVGLEDLRKLLSGFSFEEVFDAMCISVTKYLVVQAGKATAESVGHAWNKVGGICNTKRADLEKPYLRDLMYIRGILRNRLSYLNEAYAMALLEQAVVYGATIDSLKKVAKTSRTWTDWRCHVEDFISENGGTPGEEPRIIKSEGVD